MFNLTSNNFLTNGKCNYEDEYGNKVFIRRTDNGFVSKIRFYCKEQIKADPVTINLPLTNDEGFNLGVHYEKGLDIDSKAISDGIEGYRNLVEKWINMLYDIADLKSNNSMDFKDDDGNTLNEEDIAKIKLNNLRAYEELIDISDFVFE